MIRQGVPIFDDKYSKSQAPRFVLCQSIRQRPPAVGTQNSRFGGVMVQRGCSFVEATDVPRIRKPEPLKIEMMAEPVAKRAQECSRIGKTKFDFSTGGGSTEA